jgi:hypothetical protein
MTPKQLLNRVQIEADARLSDVVEHLLYILDDPPFLSESNHLVWKWEQTGFLADLDMAGKISLSKLLEQAAQQFIDWAELEVPSQKEKDEVILDEFMKLRTKELWRMDEYGPSRYGTTFYHTKCFQ